MFWRYVCTVAYFYNSILIVNSEYTVLGQKGSSDALFTPKVPIFTTLSHCAMSMIISESCPYIRKPVDNMTKVTESLNITK